MAYKIAVGSSDSVNVDLKFGEVESFLIYEVTDKVELVERRAATQKHSDSNVSCGSESCKPSSCGGNGGGCGGADGVIAKVSLIDDCRCVICKKIGFQAQKQFEKKAISVFDIEIPIDEALKKITSYYDKIDNHKSLRDGGL